MSYWLLKSDPDEFSWMDLKQNKDQTTAWDGVRNYQARNFLREMRKNDLALYYHSKIQPQTMEGVVRIIRESYPDPTQFNRKNKYFDSKSTVEDPRWVTVDIQVYRDLEPPVTRDELQKQPGLENMVLFKNSRLSVQPVRESEWKIILGLREKKD